MKNTIIHKHTFTLHPSGAVYWNDKKTLLVADVHLGKVNHFRKNGIAVPQKAKEVFYNKMKALYDTFTIDRIFFLGDLFHSDQNNEWCVFEAWVKEQKVEMILVEGNHDIIPACKFEELGIKVVDTYSEEGFCFSHFPMKASNCFVICGHIHPGVKLKGKGLQQLTLPCFFQQPHQLILPAFGAFTGLHLLKATIKDRVFVTSGKEVMEILN